MPPIFREQEGMKGEGKYLVVRRDGTVPFWPAFVLGGRDPVAPWALRFYAVLALLAFRDWAYTASIWRLARNFARYRRHLGSGDPNAARHRGDAAWVIAMMRGYPVTHLVRHEEGPPSELLHGPRSGGHDLLQQGLHPQAGERGEAAGDQAPRQ
jgi:hypothetical protein